eukprot:CAMPEP_0119357984 /NCGR_PEP_ID=MMETSP1334-20130426/6280_1 /TAXON_ID=127549 /ORGANISM="Calcidiscus leptoporus, Strain RCC1130" /LENGTH=593 /DNA_ID=CAMNT_0007372367 /DNA_START=21 /DNA_END=1802 /DNA_ORIENTATION=+
MAAEGWTAPTAPAEDGWGAAEDGIPAEGWGVDPMAVTRKSATSRPVPKKEDEAAAKEVEARMARVLADKRKIARLQDALCLLEEKRSAAQSEIDAAMPALQEMRTQLSMAIMQVQGTRLPLALLNKGKELNNKRKMLPAGCTSEKALNTLIKETDFSIDHGTLTIKQEKAAIERMRELKKGRGLVKAYEVEQAALEAAKAAHAEQVAGLTPLHVNIDELRRATDEKAAEMDKLMAARQQLRERRETASADIAEAKASLDGLFKEVRALQSDSPKAVSRFFVAVQELDTQLKAERERKQALSAPPAAAAVARAPAATSARAPSPAALSSSPTPPAEAAQGDEADAHTPPTPPPAVSPPVAAPFPACHTAPAAAAATALASAAGPAAGPPANDPPTAASAATTGSSALEAAPRTELQASGAFASSAAAVEYEPTPATAAVVGATATEKLSAGQKKRLREKAAKERATKEKVQAAAAAAAAAAVESPAKDTAEEASTQHVEAAAAETAAKAVAAATAVAEATDATAVAAEKVLATAKGSGTEKKKKAKGTKPKEKKVQQKGAASNAAPSGFMGYFVGATLLAVAVFGVGVAYAMHG